MPFRHVRADGLPHGVILWERSAAFGVQFGRVMNQVVGVLGREGNEFDVLELLAEVIEAHMKGLLGGAGQIDVQQALRIVRDGDERYQAAADHVRGWKLGWTS